MFQVAVASETALRTLVLAVGPPVYNLLFCVVLVTVVKL